MEPHDGELPEDDWDVWWREQEEARERLERLRPELTSLVEPVSRFSRELFHTVCAEAPDANQFLSPLSVHIALAICLEGASGETRRELETALHLSAAGARLAYREALKAWLGERLGADLSVANALFSRQGLELDEAFRRTLAEIYRAEHHELDFGRAEQSAAFVNDWAARQTRGMIPRIIDPAQLHAQLHLLLANVVYFKSGWEAPFEPEWTDDADFQGAAGRRTVRMMRGTQSAGYYEDDRCQVLVLPYFGGFELLVALPREGHELGDIESHLASGVADASLRYTPVEIHLPRFRLGCSYTLRDTLVACGVRRLFTDDAQWAAMTPREPTRLDDIFHLTRVAVDEEGTEAAAVTVLLAVAAAAGGSSAPPPVFRADRPFHFQIRDAVAGVPLFLGRLQQPGTP